MKPVPVKVIKVLSYKNGRTQDGQSQTQMEVIIETTKVFDLVNFDKKQLVDILSTVEEPTAAQLVALTDSYLARDDRKNAEQAARTAIVLSGGNRSVLMTLTTILMKADMVSLAKKAFSALDEAIPAYVVVEPIKKRLGSRLISKLGGLKRK